MHFDSWGYYQSDKKLSSETESSVKYGFILLVLSCDYNDKSNANDISISRHKHLVNSTFSAPAMSAA